VRAKRPTKIQAPTTSEAVYVRIDDGRVGGGGGGGGNDDGDDEDWS